MAHVRGRVRRAAERQRLKIGSAYSVSAVAALECERSLWRGEQGHCRWCNDELGPRRRSWCSDQCHREFELNHIWDEARQYTLRKARHCCERDVCTVTTDLQVNHIDPVVGRGYHPSCFHHLDNLEALCRPHHQIETNAQRRHRQQHWTDDALDGLITMPSAKLDPPLRNDLIARMLDRAAGWPFRLPGERFEQTGVYHRYRPNTPWAVALNDLKANYSRARLWSPAERMWVPLSYYDHRLQRCSGLNKSGERCQRFIAGDRCPQHHR